MRIKEPPHNVEAEQAVLACMLIEREAIITVTNMLVAEDFYREAHKLIFTAMETLFQAGEDVNLIALSDWLSNHQQLEDVGGLGYLGALSRSLPTAAQVKQYCSIVREHSLRRKLITLGRTMMASATGAEDTATQLEIAQWELQALLRSKSNLELAGINGLLDDYLTDIEMKDPDNSSFSGLSTGYHGLDLLTNGLQPADLIILAARPSMGKTAMALNIVENLFLYNRDSYAVGFFSLEMSAKQLLNRLMSMLTGIDSMRIDNNRLSDEEWHRIWLARELMGEHKLYIDSSGGLTVAKLANRARRLQMEKGLDLIVIDYLQLMSSPNRYAERQQAIAEISRELKALARELNIPIIALSQLSRAVEGRQLKRPLMSDLRESGALEQDADLIMFLYRDDYYNHQSKEPGVTELIIAKHRNGAVGNFKFFFEKEHSKFIELL